MTGVYIPIPRETDWDIWSTSISGSFTGNYVPPDDEKQWRELALAVVNTAPFNKYGLLHPNEFNTWQDWGEALARITQSGV